MKKRSKISVALAGAAVAGITAGAVAVRALSDMAVKNKDVPKILRPLGKRISGSEKDKEIFDIVEQKKLRLEGVCEPEFTITNRDGLKLTGRWYRTENPKRILIAMHGWHSCWSHDFGVSSEIYHDMGCDILYPDQRAQGKSEGEYMGLGVLERYDCIDWLNYVLETENNDLPIYLCGISMGAATVLMASELDLPERVKGILSDCGFTSPDEIWKYIMNNNLNINNELVQRVTSWYTEKRTKIDRNVSTVSALSKTKTPVLFIHGDADTFVPVEMTLQNFDACASEKEMLIVPGAGHGLSFFGDTEKYIGTIKRFFENHD